MEHKLFKKIFIVSMIFTIFISIAALMVIHNDERKYIKKDDDIKKIHIDGNYYIGDSKKAKILDKDSKISILGNNKVVIDGHFTDNITKNKLLIFKIDNMKLKIFVNGNQIYSFGDKGTYVQYSKSPGNTWDHVISPGISTKDNVRIEMYNIYTNHEKIVFNQFLDSIYCGYDSQLVLSNIKERFINYAISIFIVSMGIIAASFSYILFKMKKSISTILCFSGLAISSGTWFFIDFTTQSYFVPFLVFNNSLDVICGFFVIIFLVIYFYLHLKSKLKYLLASIAYFLMIQVIYITVKQFLNISDYYEILPMVYIICLISVLSIIYCIFYESYVINNEGAKKLRYSTIMICTGIVLDLVGNFLEILPILFWFKVGFLLFLIIQFVNIAKVLKEFISENIKVKILKQIAYKDALTGVRNRTAYFEKVREIDRSLNESYKFGVLVFDINNLKTVNDKLGHNSGDSLIIYVSRIISNIFGDSCVYRIGGDEFIVILEEEYYKSRFELLKILEDDIEKFNTTLKQELFKISIAKGMAVYTLDIDSSYQDVFCRADKSMYINKNGIKGIV